MKEIFFSDSDDEGLMGKYARGMMMYLSISVDEDLQQTLSFFEKVCIPFQKQWLSQKLSALFSICPELVHNVIANHSNSGAFTFFLFVSSWI